MKVSEQIRSAKKVNKAKQLRSAAESNAFYYIIPYGMMTAVETHLDKSNDEQSSELFMEVCEKLSQKLKLSSGEAEALNRIVQIAQNFKTWKPDLIRNNVFKAANSLGIKLPSHMF